MLLIDIVFQSLMFQPKLLLMRFTLRNEISLHQDLFFHIPCWINEFIDCSINCLSLSAIITRCIVKVRCHLTQLMVIIIDLLLEVTIVIVKFNCHIELSL